MPNHSKLLLIAAINGALGVILGAFGAHGLADLLEHTGRAATWETATLYQLVHAPAVVAVVLALPHFSRPAFARYSILCWLIGTLIFSGSLYTLAAGGPNWLGAITPIGGLFLIVGWLLLTRVGGIISSNQHNQ